MDEEDFKCPCCEKLCEEKDVKGWTNASTQAGTGYSIVHFKCSQCGFEKDYFSWYPGIDDWEDVLYVLAKDAKEK